LQPPPSLGRYLAPGSSSNHARSQSLQPFNSGVPTMMMTSLSNHCQSNHRPQIRRQRGPEHNLPSQCNQQR
jgi:hypothetical protein